MVRDDPRRNGADEKPRKRFSSWKQPGRPPTPDDDVESHSSHGSSGHMTRRERFTAIRCVDLHEYRQDYRARKYANLTVQNKIDMFGTPVMPIFVPLAPGETLEMYEQRLREWLWREHREDLDDLKRDENPFRERNQRIAFANANAVGDVVFDPHRINYTPERRKRERSASRDRDDSYYRAKRESRDDRDTKYGPSSHTSGNEGKEKKSHGSSAHSRQDEPAKPTRPIRICDYEEPKGNATSTEVLKAHLACGCTTCLFAAMGKMDKKLEEIEPKHSSDTAAGAQVIDLT